VRSTRTGDAQVQGRCDYLGGGADHALSQPRLRPRARGARLQFLCKCGAAVLACSARTGARFIRRGDSCSDVILRPARSEAWNNPPPVSFAVVRRRDPACALRGVSPWLALPYRLWVVSLTRGKPAAGGGFDAHVPPPSAASALAIP